MNFFLNKRKFILNDLQIDNSGRVIEKIVNLYDDRLISDIVHEPYDVAMISNMEWLLHVVSDLLSHKNQRYICKNYVDSKRNYFQ